LRKLIVSPGRDKNRALLLWFSGHGHTLEETDGEKVAEPVREIITAGNENEQVPDKSVFKTVFLQGISSRGRNIRELLE